MTILFLLFLQYVLTLSVCCGNTLVQALLVKHDIGRGVSSALKTSFLDIDAELLTGYLSSSERYAQALNMTVEQVAKTKEIHFQASQQLHETLRSDTLDGIEKHSLICQHRLLYGRHPFSCNQCWSYKPVCLCGLATVEQKRHLPRGIDQVLVWTHHREWGLTSNTGCLLPLTLHNTQMLMKGWPEHDELLKNTISDPDNLVVVLWPDQEKTKENSKENEPSARMTTTRTISLEEIQEQVNDHQKRVVLIAVDGTWRNARRMVSRLPESIPRLDLPMDVVFSDFERNKSSTATVAAASSSIDHSVAPTANNVKRPVSILAPLRSKGPAVSDVCERQVCTAEAVASALLQLDLSQSDGDYILDITRIKVDLIRRYRGIKL